VLVPATPGATVTPNPVNGLNVATTVFAASIVTLQVVVVVAEHAPLHPANVDVAVDDAVNTNIVCSTIDVVQSAIQLIDDVVVETVPLPVPWKSTVKLKLRHPLPFTVDPDGVPGQRSAPSSKTPSPSKSGRNVAVVLVATLGVVILQLVLVPVHAPVHPVKTYPGAGFAVNVTGVVGV